MFKDFQNREQNDEYLNEFRQKAATQKRDFIIERSAELQRSRNGFLGTIAGIALAAIVGWVLLAPKFSATGSSEIPVIRRPISPAKIQPNEPGGMEIPNQDKSVYALVEKKAQEPAKVESLLPPPETPKMPTIVPEPEPVELTAAEEIIHSEEITDSVNTSGEETIKKDNSLPVKKLDELIEEVESTSGKKISIPEKLPEIKVEPKTVSQEKATPQPKPSAKTDKSPQSVSSAAASSVKAGMWQVQLIASANKDAVNKAWNDLSAKYSFLKQYPHEIESAKIANGTIFHRLKAGNFSTRNDADKLCDKIKKAGGSCIVKQK